MRLNEIHHNKYIKFLVCILLLTLLTYVVYVLYFNKNEIETYSSENSLNNITICEVGKNIFSSKHHILLYNNQICILKFDITCDTMQNFSPPTIKWMSNSELNIKCYGDGDTLVFHLIINKENILVDWYMSTQNGLDEYYIKESDYRYNIKIIDKIVTIDTSTNEKRPNYPNG